MMEAKLTQLESKLDALLVQFKEAAGDAAGDASEPPKDEEKGSDKMKDESEAKTA
jgi:hypothetical protein